MPDQSPAPESSPGFAGTLKSKWGPLPVWGWLALITVVLLGYWLYQQRQGGSQAQQQTSSSVGQPGVVVINQDEPEPSSAPAPGPLPPPVKPPKPPETRQITVSRNETLGQLAKQRHWSQETLQDVEAMNVTAGQGEWTPGTKLKKGQTVIRPLGS